MNKDRWLRGVPAVLMAGGLGMFALAGCGSNPEASSATSSPAAKRPTLAPTTLETTTTTTAVATSTTFLGGAMLGPATAECNASGVAVPATPEPYPGPCQDTASIPLPTK